MLLLAAAGLGGCSADGVGPAVDPATVVPGRRTSSWATLVAREGTTLTVRLVAPACGRGYARHLHESDGVIVVWATGGPPTVECAAAVSHVETFHLRAPVGGRAVVDHLGDLVLPEP